MYILINIPNQIKFFNLKSFVNGLHISNIIKKESMTEDMVYESLIPKLIVIIQ